MRRVHAPLDLFPLIETGDRQGLSQPLRPGRVGVSFIVFRCRRLLARHDRASPLSRRVADAPIRAQLAVVRQHVLRRASHVILLLGIVAAALDKDKRRKQRDQRRLRRVDAGHAAANHAATAQRRVVIAFVVLCARGACEGAVCE